MCSPPVSAGRDFVELRLATPTRYFTGLNAHFADDHDDITVVLADGTREQLRLVHHDGTPRFLDLEAKLRRVAERMASLGLVLATEHCCS